VEPARHDAPATDPTAPAGEDRDGAPAIRVLEGDCLSILPTLPDASYDAVVCDPPYLLRFRGEGWDTAPWSASAKSTFAWGDGAHPNPRIADMVRFSAWCEAWAAECLRVLKPGGHLLAFGGARTHHWLAVGVESAGFEIRDCIAWLKFGGFPKSTDLGKHFDRRAGAARPVLGVRRLQNIRGGGYLQRPGVARRDAEYADTAPVTELAQRWDGWGSGLKPMAEPVIVARKPLDGNLIDNAARHGTGALNIGGCRIPWDGACGGHFGGRNTGGRPGGRTYAGTYDRDHRTVRHPRGRFPGNAITLEPDAFWSPYTLVSPPEVSRKIGYGDREPYSDHPTQKPVPLMRWLCRLVTPPGGRVLDPFAGSGSTGVASLAEGFDAVLIEIDPHYAAIARRRVAEAQGAPPPGEERARGPRQVSLFEVERQR
jgi:site-specific DNA-methyltransferase (adenine-specific)